MSFYGAALLMVAAATAYISITAYSQLISVGALGLLPYKASSILLLQASFLTSNAPGPLQMSDSIDGIMVRDANGTLLAALHSGLYCVKGK